MENLPKCPTCGAPKKGVSPPSKFGPEHIGMKAALKRIFTKAYGPATHVVYIVGIEGNDQISVAFPNGGPIARMPSVAVRRVYP